MAVQDQLLEAEGEPSSPVASLSSSFKERTPARSYYMKSFHSRPEGFPRSFQSVREDTAALASRALSESAANNQYQETHEPLKDQRVQSSRTNQRLVRTCDVYGGDQAASAGVSHEAEEASVGHDRSEHERSSRSMLTQLMKASASDEQAIAPDDASSSESEASLTVATVSNAIISQPSETTPLVQRNGKPFARERRWSLPWDVEAILSMPRGRLRSVQALVTGTGERLSSAFRKPRRSTGFAAKEFLKSAVLAPLGYLPAVALGLLLNILDALSYGIILFPLGNSIFSGLGPDGMAMFYVSTIISQLVYSLGGSAFRGGIGSEMIEVVPFFHKMAFTIVDGVGDDQPRAVLATTILSYAFSSVLTGLVFFALGYCRLGSLTGFFPRHILVGCIGGVGYFLVATGLEVSARLEGDLNYNWETLEKLLQQDTVFLWTLPLLLAITLFVLKRWIKHSLTDALFFGAVIVVFHLCVLAIPGLSQDELRSQGWLFESPPGNVPWYHFYTLYDFPLVDWAALAATIPAMLALTFFGILHVPINVPALAFSTGEDNVDVDRELRAHGYSNALSGLCGSIQNYLVYTNTVLFMRSGGNSRIAGVLLATATFGVLLTGPLIIGYIPIMVIGALIFYLGLDLLKEALYDTWGRLHKLEYLTIIIIVVTMGAYDFVAGSWVPGPSPFLGLALLTRFTRQRPKMLLGIFGGIILACVGYVLRTSQVSAIRASLPGGIASSTVRRNPVQHSFLQEVGQQIYVVRLAGYLFFGTIVGVEKRIRTILHDEFFRRQPIRFLILDITSVDGVDFSAAEAFARINRLLRSRSITLVMCGFSASSEIGKSLENIGLFEGSSMEYFETLNYALEFCENELLKTFHHRVIALDRRASETAAVDIPEASPKINTLADFNNSPRTGQLLTVATNKLDDDHSRITRQRWKSYSQPFQLILQTFAGLSSRGEDFWLSMVPFFTRREFAAGSMIYSSGDKSDAFYMVEHGMLRAVYRMPQGDFSEVIVAGATCGELPFFSETSRTSTTFADRDSVTWVLDGDGWHKLQRQQPEAAQELLKISLKLTSERMETITKYMLVAGTGKAGR